MVRRTPVSMEDTLREPPRKEVLRLARLQPYAWELCQSQFVNRLARRVNRLPSPMASRPSFLLLELFHAKTTD